MVDYNKLNQFISIDSPTKYGKTGGYTFNDGTLVCIWFKKNKKEIFSWNNELSKKIKKEYEAFLESIKNKSTFNSIYVSDKNILAEEFYLCPSNDKFKDGSKLCFENGINMYEWFARNKKYIIESKSKVCLEIINQYKSYLHDLRKKEIITYHKHKIIFHKEKDLNKFDYSYKFKFADGTFMSLWFDSNKEKIKNSDSPLDFEIWQQYMVYFDLKKLKDDFMNVSDYSKFDSKCCLRFSSGALMHDWWIANKDDVFNHKTQENMCITRQYNEYLKDKCNNIMVKNKKV